MNSRLRQRDATRTAILEALAQEITASGFGFSIQDVANRAGLSHRTVYNHFPTRQALNDAFAVYVEEVLARDFGSPPDLDADLAKLVAISGKTYEAFARRDAHVRAYVVLMLASRAPAKVSVDRTERFAKQIRKEAPSVSPASARLVAAALRMFVSSTGFHLLTEHLQLSTAEASAVCTWATKTLVAAVKAGKTPRMEVDHGRSDRG